MDKKIKTWRQGEFIDGPEYNQNSEAWKKYVAYDETLKVRPSPKGNAICLCPEPMMAEWIAERLNLAAKLEEMLHGFYNGDIDEITLIDFIKNLQIIGK